MTIAPTSYSVPMNRSRPDAVEILGFMGRVIDWRRDDPFLRSFATNNLLDGVKDNDTGAMIDRALKFVREQMVYVRDPQRREYILDPAVSLYRILDKGQGGAKGDCDCHSMLLAGLLESMGVPTRFIAVKQGGTVWDHVMVAAYDGKRWRALDPTAKFSPQADYDEFLSVDPKSNKGIRMHDLESLQAIGGLRRRNVQPVGAFNPTSFVNILTGLSDAAANIYRAVDGSPNVSVPVPAPQQPTIGNSIAQGGGSNGSSDIWKLAAVAAAAGLIVFLVVRKK